MKKQGYWFKLSFKNKKAWDELYYKYFNPESEDCLFVTIQIITAKRLRREAVLSTDSNGMFEVDEETGGYIVAIPAGLQPDFAVDLISDVGLDVLKELEKYVIEERENYQIGIGSFVGELVVKKKEKK